MWNDHHTDSIRPKHSAIWYHNVVHVKYIMGCRCTGCICPTLGAAVGDRKYKNLWPKLIRRDQNDWSVWIDLFSCVCLNIGISFADFEVRFKPVKSIICALGIIHVPARDLGAIEDYKRTYFICRLYVLYNMIFPSLCRSRYLTCRPTRYRCFRDYRKITYSDDEENLLGTCRSFLLILHKLEQILRPLCN